MSSASACAPNAVGERLDVLRLDREAGGGAVAAEALEVLGAGERARRAGRRRCPRGPSPSSRRRGGAGDQDDRAAVPLDEPRGDDADHALVPVLAGDDVAAAAAAGIGPRLDLGGRRAEDPVLDGLALAVQVLELLGELLGLARVVGEEQRERRLGPAEPAGGVDPRSEPEADRALVAGRRIDAGDAHQRAQPGLLGLREPAEAEQRERAALVDERDDVGDGRERDDVEVAVEERMPGSEERLGELPDDRGAAETGERVVALERRDDRAGRERVAGTVVVGDDDLEPEPRAPPRPRPPR